MPHRKKKSFIEKKKAVTFHLVHRSQRDPLAADEKAPQHVLLPAAKVDAEKRLEEQRNFGVFFDDDYDYLQHLKEASGPSELVATGPSYPDRGSCDLRDEEEEEEKEKEVEAVSKELPEATLHLPSSVFASEFEEDVGLLNKAAPVSGPRLDMDPDIVAALDEDFDFDDPDNILEDDFILKANCTDRALDAEASVQRGQQWARHHFLTASPFYEQFDDDEIGALDNAELEGFIGPDSGRLEEVIRDYFKEKQKDSLRPEDLGPKELPVVKEEDEDEEEEEMETVAIEAPQENWDCETIISTYSNLYNRPKIIEEPPKPKPIRVSNRTGIPLDVLPSKGLTAKQAERMTRINDSDLPRVSTQPRSREESKEEKKARKQAIKEERKERRVEKKANKTAFKEEKARQEKQMLNLRTNIQGLKL
ncbi:PREDICTED: protein LTV1 homolog [Cyprinodon variegatus]|uniref:protein LTV1 homolog n=1 Tax=Cyprinodon variegatus TaxID=28743 RepID=UPI0007428464|nr:PREDICTED: protein LTV1 homolog [Cyprinodon variegatus]